MSEPVSTTGRSMIFAGGVGTATGEARTAAEAMVAGGLDWRVGIVRAGFETSGGFVPCSGGSRAVCRLDEDGDALHDFGMVKSKYHVIQNDEMFRFCDDLVDDSGAKYEAAWSLHGGKEVGLTMKLPDTIEVGGTDPYERYLLLRGRHDGTGSIRAQITKVRLFCTNMLNTASRGAESTYRIHHLANATQRLAAAREALSLTFKHDEAFAAEMEQLLVPMSDARFVQVVTPLLTKHRFGGVEAKGRTLVALRAESPTLQDEFRATSYGALQALTEWTDWVAPYRTAEGKVFEQLDGRVVKLKNDLTQALVAAGG